MNKLKSLMHGQPAIELRIEELVLHGFTPGNHYEVADAVQYELVRLLTHRDMSAEIIAGQRTIDAGAFEVDHGAGPDRIGVQVAQSVYGGLTRGSIKDR